MQTDGLLQFDENGRLYINHDCEACKKFPLENLNEACLECGYSRSELIQLEGLVNRANKAIDMMSNALTEEDGKEIDVREVFLHVKEIRLGGDKPDMIILQDLDMTDGIRDLSDLAEHMVRVIIYPTNMRMIEGVYAVFDSDVDVDEDDN